MLREFLRGAAEVHVLRHAAEGAVHGAWPSVEQRRHGYDISPGTLYPLLDRMEESGLLVSHKGIVEGRIRPAYEATDAGRRELAGLRVAVAELVAELADEVLTYGRRLSNERPQSRSTLARGGPRNAGVPVPAAVGPASGHGHLTEPGSP